MTATYIPESVSASISTRLAPNSGYAIVAPYFSTYTSGTGNWGGSTGNTSKEFITVGHNFRIRQNGTVSRVKLYFANLTNLTGFYVKVWRKNSLGTYDLVGTSENLIGKVSAGVNTVDLTSSISGVQEGDYYGYRMEWNTNGAWNLRSANHTTTCTTYYVTNSTPAATNFNWAAQSSSSEEVVIELYMTPPVFVAIGDSIISGYPGSHSYIDVGPMDNIYTSIPFNVARALGYPYQSMGIGGEPTGPRAARFAADVVNLSPRFVIIEGGTINLWSAAAPEMMTTMEACLADFKTMLDYCASNNITPVAVLIFPRTNLPNADAQRRERWNAALSNLVSVYDAIIVDSDEFVGQNRSGGDAGNLWDIKTAYDYDGTHMNAQGHRAIAQAIIDAIDKYHNSSPR